MTDQRLFVSQAVEIRTILRGLRGGSQSFLVHGSDDHFYVAKCRNNPQGIRTLANEVIVSQIFREVGVLTPIVRALRLTPQTEMKCDFRFSVGNRQIRIEDGIHFGSQCPVNPLTTAIFDVLPGALVGKVSNLEDFGFAWVVDQWVGNTDSRQAIFVRKDKTSQLKLSAYFIDHGKSFDGMEWRFWDSARRSLCADPLIYASLPMLKICDAAVERIQKISRADLGEMARQIPAEWLNESDYCALQHVLDQLYQRKSRLPDTIRRNIQALLARTAVQSGWPAHSSGRKVS